MTHATPSRYAPVLLVAVLLCAVPGTALAQSNGDGSIYSRFGLGALNTYASPQGQALGGGGAALRSLNYTSLSNPALWSDQVLTRFVAGANYQETIARDANGDESRLSAGTLSGIQFSFPLYTRTLGFSVGYHPYSQMNYRVIRTDEAPLLSDAATDAETSTYTINYEGRGGLQQVTGGLGWRMGDALSVGASVNAIFGILEEGQRTVIEDGGFLPVNFTDATRLSGVTGTFGGLLTLSGVLGSEDALSLGGAFTLPASLSGQRVRTLGESLSRDTIGTAVDGSVELPWRLRGGLAYQPNSHWTFVADGLYAPWSAFETTFDDAASGPSRFPIGGSELLNDRWRASTGVELMPGDASSGSFFARMAYRLGGYYEQSYAAPVPGEAIRVRAVTAGLSLPTSFSGTRIDLNVEAGTRGTTDQNLVRDGFYGLSINVNIGERWFQERKLR